MTERICYSCADYDDISGGCIRTGESVCADDVCDKWVDTRDVPDGAEGEVL